MTDDETPRLWRGNTLGDRTAVRRGDLLRAGYALVGDGGVPALTMRAVCREAGLSLRYFYESFTNTDELLTEVFDGCNTDLLTAVAVAGISDVRAAVDAAAGFFADDPRRVRILLREPLSNELLGARRFAITPGLLATLADTDPATLTLAASSLSGALTALVLDWTDGRLDVARDELVDHATQLVHDALAHQLSRNRSSSSSPSPGTTR